MDGRNDTTQTDVAAIEEAIVEYLVANHAVDFAAEDLLRETPLFEQDIIDSLGFIDLIAFVEDTWGVSFAQSEQTDERLGTVRKMAVAVAEKLSGVDNAG